MESVPDTFPSLFLGYSVIIGCLAGYILYLGKRLARIEKKLAQTER